MAEFDLKRIKDDILHNIDRSLLGISTSAEDVENRSLYTSVVNTATGNSTTRRQQHSKPTLRTTVPGISYRRQYPQALTLEDSILSDFKKNNNSTGRDSYSQRRENRNRRKVETYGSYRHKVGDLSRSIVV